MRTSTALVRIRFPRDVLQRLDLLADRLRHQARRRIPRAAVVRALVRIHMAEDDLYRIELREALQSDDVRRGRAKGNRCAREAG